MDKANEEKIDVQKIIYSLENILSKNRIKTIPLQEPQFLGKEWHYVKDCLDTGWVSSAGSYVERFESLLSEYTGAPYVVATVNGTSALHMCLLLAKVQPDEEVLLPSLTFVATANAISYCGAIPHFVDVDEATLGIDANKLRSYLHEIATIENNDQKSFCRNRQTGRIIKAIIPMHTFGHPVDMDPLVELSQQFGIKIIEDAAESLGSFYKNRHTGTMSDLAAISFNGNKIITTGGGGAILTNNQELAILAKHLTTTAKTAHPWAYYHDSVGYNYRLPNINAALGCAQIENLPFLVKRKRELAQKYEETFKNFRGLRFFTEPSFAQSNYWLNTLILNENGPKELEKLLSLTNKSGIMTRPVWTPLHQLPIYKKCPAMTLEVTESLAQRIINIPSSANLIEA
ncbi:LegC family aminotransferase [Heliorestis acidaminivorans]|uniref:LegC family aminotransferase n=1 Tax=Heliorestis acidaminivorans TaxID=553427 RepID=A0A6I0ESP1_9FIRM|nr:LegC family aminotransferase [Heliorestis acidaminivorans]KAB2953625.1 LegC family aminotransferase [Heliorestis acidaminivorans]